MLYSSRYYFWWSLLRTRVLSLSGPRSKRPRLAKTCCRKLFQGQRPRKASGALSMSPWVRAKVLHLYQKGRTKPGVKNGQCGTIIWDNHQCNFYPLFVGIQLVITIFLFLPTTKNPLPCVDESEINVEKVMEEDREEYLKCEYSRMVFTVAE